ncbi:MAG: hypothetical protein M1838_003274 [Thelocarpon superellum]|nr:MAG: hypothetical protein M1838_003274 [Thelocarpon superellum]
MRATVLAISALASLILSTWADNVPSGPFNAVAHAPDSAADGLTIEAYEGRFFGAVHPNVTCGPSPTALCKGYNRTALAFHDGLLYLETQSNASQLVQAKLDGEMVYSAAGDGVSHTADGIHDFYINTNNSLGMPQLMVSSGLLWLACPPFQGTSGPITWQILVDMPNVCTPVAQQCVWVNLTITSDTTAAAFAYEV